MVARARKPWDHQAWGGVRKAADDVLRKGKVTTMTTLDRAHWFKRREVEQVLPQVRDEDEVEQFERLDKKQQEEMVKYKRPIIGHEEKTKTMP